MVREHTLYDFTYFAIVKVSCMRCWHGHPLLPSPGFLQHSHLLHLWQLLALSARSTVILSNSAWISRHKSLEQTPFGYITGQAVRLANT